MIPLTEDTTRCYIAENVSELSHDYRAWFVSIYKTMNENTVYVYKVGELDRLVWYNKDTGHVQAGCFLGDVRRFKEQISTDYGKRISLAKELKAFDLEKKLIRLKDEYLTVADYFQKVEDELKDGEV